LSLQMELQNFENVTHRKDQGMHVDDYEPESDVRHGRIMVNVVPTPS